MTSPGWTCPRCGAELTVAASRCPQCGTSRWVAQASEEARWLLLAEEALSAAQRPETTEALIPRLGERLVAQGLITQAQLEEALAYQQRRAAEGRPLRLGQALVELGYLSPDTLDRVIAEYLWQLQQALREANQRLENRVRERTQQLSQALRRLSELNRMKSNFIATVSHELRTPLTHILGYLEMLQAGLLGTLAPEQREAVETSLRAARRLHQLIEDLLRYALLSRGEIHLRIEAVDAVALAREALREIRPRARAKGVVLHSALPAPPLTVEADGEKIGWVLTQLLDNGVKFTPKGGEVTLEVRGEFPWVRFEVRDTGIGIPPERLEEIFEPFHQLEDAATRRHGGMGLGLALVMHILQAHQTRLEVHSVPGQGSRFWFRLPLASTLQGMGGEDERP